MPVSDNNMPKEPKDTPQATIVRAALECLEQYGMEGLTVRKIAIQAKVNVAAINYHFRSKEKLLEQVFELVSNQAFQDIDERIQARSGKKLERELEEFLRHYIEGLLNYPNMSRVVIQQLLNPSPVNINLTTRLEIFLQALTERLARLHGADANDLKLRLKTAEFISLMISLSLMPDVFRKSLGIDLQAPEMQAKLISGFIQNKS
jgi:TetR/AcrR family transcriptional regulator, regulator of cefoperazone and chloramphenicol sensitivity